MLGQRKLLQRLGPGLVHAFIFWGFLVLFPTIFMAIAAIVDREEPLASDAPLGWLESQGWYALLVDIFVVLVLVGVVVAFGIRKVQRPRRSQGQPPTRGRSHPPIGLRGRSSPSSMRPGVVS